MGDITRSIRELIEKIDRINKELERSEMICPPPGSIAAQIKDAREFDKLLIQEYKMLLLVLEESKIYREKLLEQQQEIYEELDKEYEKLIQQIFDHLNNSENQSNDEMEERIKDIDQSIDKLQESINKISKKIDELDNKINMIDNDIKENESKISKLNNAIDAHIEDMNANLETQMFDYLYDVIRDKDQQKIASAEPTKTPESSSPPEANPETDQQKTTNTEPTKTPESSSPPAAKPEGDTKNLLSSFLNKYKLVLNRDDDISGHKNKISSAFSDILANIGHEVTDHDRNRFDKFADNIPQFDLLNGLQFKKGSFLENISALKSEKSSKVAERDLNLNEHKRLNDLVAKFAEMKENFQNKNQIRIHR